MYPSPIQMQVRSLPNASMSGAQALQDAARIGNLEPLVQGRHHEEASILILSHPTPAIAMHHKVTGLTRSERCNGSRAERHQPRLLQNSQIRGPGSPKPASNKDTAAAKAGSPPEAYRPLFISRYSGGQSRKPARSVSAIIHFKIQRRPKSEARQKRIRHYSFQDTAAAKVGSLPEAYRSYSFQLYSFPEDFGISPTPVCPRVHPESHGVDFEISTTHPPQESAYLCAHV